jgi:hypothetical protein
MLANMWITLLSNNTVDNIVDMLIKLVDRSCG